MARPYRVRECSMLPSPRTRRKAPLSAALSVALALSTTSIPLPAVEVQNCGDGGPGSGSLRDVIASAAPGATVDLSQLPTKCGMPNSVITLSGGEIVVAQDNLTLQGPYSDAGSIAIVAAPGSQARIFSHTGSGLLAINNLTIANGNVQAAAYTAAGGCVRSVGSIFLHRSTVKDCTVDGDGAYGGGIYVRGDFSMIASTISGNRAIGHAYRGSGGGVAASGNLQVKYSTLSGNDASTFGGGVYADLLGSGASIVVTNSTIEGNNAGGCDGGTLYSDTGVTILNSTISGNTGTYPGAICVDGKITISNSTIAFNEGNGIEVWGGPTTTLELQSSIIAENTSAYAYDVDVENGAAVIGSNNLVMTTNANLSGIATVTSSPKLGPLQFNGGLTRTHALLPDSPAIGLGNNTAGSVTDQRGTGYPRTTGPSASADMGAFQFDSIFADGCEWQILL